VSRILLTLLLDSLVYYSLYYYSVCSCRSSYTTHFTTTAAPSLTMLVSLFIYYSLVGAMLSFHLISCVILVLSSLALLVQKCNYCSLVQKHNSCVILVQKYNYCLQVQKYDFFHFIACDILVLSLLALLVHKYNY
jgi:hypothetical protein